MYLNTVQRDIVGEKKSRVSLFYSDGYSPRTKSDIYAITFSYCSGHETRDHPLKQRGKSDSD